MHPLLSPLPLCVLGLLCASPALSGEESPESTWPGWRGPGWDDAGRLEADPEATLSLRVAWRRSVGSGYAAVAVAEGGAVTLASADGVDRVVALDAADGSDLWQAPLGPTYPGQDGAVDGGCSTPAIANGRVHALSPFGLFVTLDGRTGERLWEVDLVETFGSDRPHWGFTTSPLVVGDLVVVMTGGGPGEAFTAFDAATGDLAWRAGQGDVEYPSPILCELGGRPQLVGATAFRAYGLDPEDGSELWQYDHGGQGFYEGILNPTWLPGDLLLWKHQSGLSHLAEVVEDGGRFTVEHVWNSRHLRQNYNLAVHHEGLLFGHGGDFLTCVDSGTGERLWRSREPGNGWLVRAGNRLCVLTKQGTLHLAPASPDGYEEEARLDLFRRNTWTPPSLAYGKVYARDSFSDVACVELVPGAAPSLAGESPELDGLAAEDASLLAALEAGETFPRIEEGRRVRFVRRAEAGDVALSCELLDGGAVSMRRIPGSDVFTATLEAEPDARFTYTFVDDFETTVVDPLNPLTDRTLSGTPVSRVDMPGAPSSEAPRSFEGVPLDGRLETHSFKARERDAGTIAWLGSREIQVYLPPGYDTSGERYPVLYFCHGKELLETLEAPHRIEALIAEGLPPLVLVFVERTSAYEYARSHKDAYRGLLVEELVPWVDETYRTLADAAHRGLHGIDEAGFAALYVSALHPDVFGLVAVQSMWTVAAKDTEVLAAAIRGASALPSRVYVDWGCYDLRQAAQATSVAGSSRRLAELLRQAGVDVRLRVSNDGGFAGLWAERLPGLVRMLFGS